MQKYLVCLDGSGYSINALENAIKLAEKSGGLITMLTVFNIDALGLGPNSSKMSYNNTLNKNTEKLRDYLTSLEETYRSDSYRIEKLIRIGNVANEIINESQNHDLVFIGSRGLGAIKRAFLGSSTSKVINNSETPTLVIKEATDYKRILVPLDGSRHSKRALIKANEIGKEFGSELVLLNVINNVFVPQMETFDLELAMNFSEEARSESKDILENAKSYITSYPYKVETITVEGDPVTTILNVAEEEEVDLIAMGSKGMGAISRAIMGSVSTEVVHKSKVSVLIYR